MKLKIKNTHVEIGSTAFQHSPLQSLCDFMQNNSSTSLGMELQSMVLERKKEKEKAKKERMPIGQRKTKEDR